MTLPERALGVTGLGIDNVVADANRANNAATGTLCYVQRLRLI
jgi:hypothetical protein